jgi:hypothetical protein
MKTTILLTYRPTFQSGGHGGSNASHYQDENGIWRDEAGNPWPGKNELETAIRAINKNSIYFLGCFLHFFEFFLFPYLQAFFLIRVHLH